MSPKEAREAPVLSPPRRALTRRWRSSRRSLVTFHIITIFPESVVPYLGASILGRAISRGFLAVALYNPRDYTQDVHRSVDDKAYGGGPGMVMRALPILKAAARARG